MANKLILTVSVILLATVLLTSTIVAPQAFAKSKVQKAYEKGLNDFFDEKGNKDACAIFAVKENNGEPLESEWVYNNTGDDQCEVVFDTPDNQTETPPTDNQTETPPVDNQTEVPPVDNQTEIPPVDNQTEIPPTDNQTIPPIDNGTVGTPDNETGIPPHCNTNEFWNGTACSPNPTIPTCDTGEFYNATSELCEQIPVTTPDNETEIPPVDNQTEIPPVETPMEKATIIGVGDVECSGDGIKVLNQIKRENPTLVLNLGDLCYDSSTGNYLSTWGTLGNLLACQIGNHDAEEDGSAQLYKDFLAYCGNNYHIKQAGVLISGVNTNDNENGMKAQSQNMVSKFRNATFMEGIHTVIVASHKPICMAAPGAEHPVNESPEVKAAFCQPIKESINPTVKLIFLNGHNHYMAKGEQSGITFVESGAGGKNHYECSTNAVFKFCNDTKFGFWKLTAISDGTITQQFKDMNGGVVN